MNVQFELIIKPLLLAIDLRLILNVHKTIYRDRYTQEIINPLHVYDGDSFSNIIKETAEIERCCRKNKNQHVRSVCVDMVKHELRILPKTKTSCQSKYYWCSI